MAMTTAADNVRKDIAITTKNFILIIFVIFF